nr:protein INVOLVED IN DE NOVO 2-like [Quercus suber]
MKHMGDDGDVEILEKVDTILKQLRDKGELEDLEALNQTLIVKERKSNDELQEARKELVNMIQRKQTTYKYLMGPRRDFTYSKQIYWKKVLLILLLRAVMGFSTLHLPSIIMSQTQRFIPFYYSLNA